MPCACGEELLIDREIREGKCLGCMMLEFQEKLERAEEARGKIDIAALTYHKKYD